jgi:hypothetical protein
MCRLASGRAMFKQINLLRRVLLGGFFDGDRQQAIPRLKTCPLLGYDATDGPTSNLNQ